MKIVIVGGGTAGWIAAAMLSKAVPGHRVQISLVESADVGPIGVGEATVPSIQNLHVALGINEADFIRAASATVKLAIRFDGWGQHHQSYLHAFGSHGLPFDGVSFHHHWLRYRQAGGDVPLAGFSMSGEAARRGRFSLAAGGLGVGQPNLSYAYHLDAGAYAGFLRLRAISQGVRHVVGTIVKVETDTVDGFITGLKLADGSTLEGDFFIDCSGFASLLIGKTLEVPFDDWHHWLPCDRAVVVQAETGKRANGFTTSTAHGAGWLWRIPLQHRSGNGCVYSSSFMDDESAASLLLSALPGIRTTDPRVIRFSTGRRRTPWHKNCLAIGLSSGFLEPLESTSIHLITTAVFRFLALLPGDPRDDTLAREFNAQSEAEIIPIRDFIILHYALRHSESDFNGHVRHMALPDSLRERLELFRREARISVSDRQLFQEWSWATVMTGQGVAPLRTHPISEAIDPTENARRLKELRARICDRVERMPPLAVRDNADAF